jgi:hypothetical protein
MINCRSEFFRKGGKSKCHGCRINNARMPNPPVSETDQDLLQCGCKIKEALVEIIYVKLGIVGQEISEDRKEEGSGWKALSRPERERILRLLELLGSDLNDLIKLIQE